MPLDIPFIPPLYFPFRDPERIKAPLVSMTRIFHSFNNAKRPHKRDTETVNPYRIMNIKLLTFTRWSVTVPGLEFEYVDLFWRLV